MKPEDQAAFERKYGKAAYKSIFELSTYELRMDAWQAALAHRDAQPAVAVNEPWYSLLCNLVEGLNKTHWSSWQTTAHFQQELNEAEAAIAAAQKELDK